MMNDWRKVFRRRLGRSTVAAAAIGIMLASAAVVVMSTIPEVAASDHQPETYLTCPLSILTPDAGHTVTEPVGCQGNCGWAVTGAWHPRCGRWQLRVERKLGAAW